MGRLEKEAPSRQIMGEMVYEEIRRAENIKVGFLDQAAEQQEFYILISREIDQYLTHLRNLHTKIAPVPQHLDQQAFASEQPDIDRTLRLMKELEERERLGL